MDNVRVGIVLGGDCPDGFVRVRNVRVGIVLEPLAYPTFVEYGQNNNAPLPETMLT